MSFFSLGFGIGTQNLNQEWLEVFYPLPLLNPSQSIIDVIKTELSLSDENTAIEVSIDQLKSLSEALTSHSSELSSMLQHYCHSKSPIVLTYLPEDKDPTSTAEVYLKLHLLSHRLVTPHSVNSDRHVWHASQRRLD